MSNTGEVLLLVAVLIVAVIGVVYLALATKRRPILDQAKYQAHWLEIDHSLEKDNAASWQLAIMNADKLLDQALRERHFSGKTMGERMKAAQTSWRNANHVWSAHKIRNQLAHETNAHVSYDITLRALAAYKQGLKDLGAI
ncbi:MAG: hypothetical protein ABIP74_01600 [Candidatus Saccharimonas sp.]